MTKLNFKLEKIFYIIFLTFLAGLFINVGFLFLGMGQGPIQRFLTISAFLVFSFGGFVVLPTIVTNRVYGKGIIGSYQDVINWKISAIILSVILPISGYFLGINRTFFFLAIAILEEYLFRYIFLSLLQIDYQYFYAVIIESLVFAVLLHLDANILDNLIVRFPAGILFSVVCSKFKLQSSITIHWLYNILVSL